jgi:hypothetical protein
VSDDTAVSLDLDALEREGATGVAAKPPFTITLGGERIMLSDATEIDWKSLMVAMSDPAMFFRLIVPADSQEAFFSTPLPAWKLNALMEAYTKHYGLTPPGEVRALPR